MKVLSLSPKWIGNSDTETLLEAIEAWGLAITLSKTVGMFSLALWDQQNRELQLARDRFGEKPLYFGLSGVGSKESFLFGSDLAALRAWPGFNNSINKETITQFFRFSAISAPNCIYERIQQLLPGHLLKVKLPFEKIVPPQEPWWCFRNSNFSDFSSSNSYSSKGLLQPYSNEDEALKDLELALLKSVEQQSLADVPLGCFLSGGIDSSLITALLQSTNSKPVRTFTISFEETEFNEAPFSKAIASHLGTDHYEAKLTASDARDLIPLLPKIYSEPFADSSQLPTHLVYREARQSGLKVALSGDGGDELFGGYNRYFWGPRIWDRLAWMPFSMRRLLGCGIKSIPPIYWEAFGGAFPINQVGQKAHKLGERLRHVRTSEQLYRSLVSEWTDPTSLLIQKEEGTIINEPSSPLDWTLPEITTKDPVARMMICDTLNYLPNDILTKLDRAAMAASLETRAPFLDHRVAEIAWRLPMHMKIPQNSRGKGKWALRQILYKHVPPELVDRPKSGFGIPMGKWLRGPLLSWAEELLSPDVIQRQGYLNPDPIQSLWKEHLSGRFDNTNKLWSVLMWQAWLEEWSK